MMEFDPIRIASEWHTGQGSAMYAYACHDRIPTETFKDQLVSEIENAMTHADDEQLDELEYFLMHVEESHPDRYPNDEMHEEVVTDPEVLDQTGKDEWYDASAEKENPAMDEADGLKCESCGKMKTEGVCECSVMEANREPSTYDYDNSGMSLDAKRSAAAERSRREARPYVDYNKKKDAEDLDEVELGWLKQAASKVKDFAMTDLGGPEGFLSPADRAEKHGKTRKGGESDDFRAWKERRAMKAESTLRQAIVSIVNEMKLSVAGRSPFHFGGASEVTDDDIAHFLISKKKDETPPESGVKVKQKKAKPKLSRKSKKAG